MLKKIGTDARLELEKIVDKKVYLELNVQIEKEAMEKIIKSIYKVISK